MKKLLVCSSVLAALIALPCANAQMSMDEQIARIYQAEQEIKAIDAAKEAERQEAAKRAADIKQRAEKARQKEQAAQRKAQQERQAKLQAYEDESREIDLEIKRLDLELKRAQVNLQKKMAEARAARATLNMFMPVPPNISLTNITEKATANANIHNGQFTGIIKGISMPLTRYPSCISSPFICAHANSMPRPTI